MAFSKADHYAPDEQMVGKYCRSVMHPARQRILKQLCKEGILNVKEIRKGHPIIQPTISNHLKILSDPPFVESNEQFPFTYYNMNRAEVLRARQMIIDFFDCLLESNDVEQKW